MLFGYFTHKQRSFFVQNKQGGCIDKVERILYNTV